MNYIINYVVNLCRLVLGLAYLTLPSFYKTIQFGANFLGLFFQQATAHLSLELAHKLIRLWNQLDIFSIDWFWTIFWVWFSILRMIELAQRKLQLICYVLEIMLIELFFKIVFLNFFWEVSSFKFILHVFDAFLEDEFVVLFWSLFRGDWVNAHLYIVNSDLLIIVSVINIKTKFPVQNCK